MTSCRPATNAAAELSSDDIAAIKALEQNWGASFEVLRRLGGSEFEFSLSVPLVLEYEAVAKRQARELGLTLDEINDVLDYLCSVGSHHQIFYLWRPFLRDPSDDMVLELAVEAGAEYIVTHILRDFARVEEFGIEAITPGQLLRRLGL